MKIFLNLTKDRKIELLLEGDEAKKNPDWAYNWAKKNMPEACGELGFKEKGGRLNISDPKNILSCLDTWSKNNKNQHINEDNADQTPSFPWCLSSINIPNVERLNQLLPEIEEMVKEKDFISQEKFKILKPVAEAVKPANQISKFRRFLADLKGSSQEKQTTSLEQFTARHTKLYTTNLDNGWTLRDYVQDAQKEKNKSREVFLSLQWMKADGSLTDNAPKDVQAAAMPIISEAKDISSQEYSGTLADLRKMHPELGERGLEKLKQREDSSSLLKFIAKHKELYKQDMGLLGVLRGTKINEKWTLSDCVQHAQKHNNRSGDAFIKLGWMDKKGDFTMNAPMDVKNAAKPVKNTVNSVFVEYKQTLQLEKHREAANKTTPAQELPSNSDQLGRSK